MQLSSESKQQQPSSQFSHKNIFKLSRRKFTDESEEDLDLKTKLNEQYSSGHR